MPSDDERIYLQTELQAAREKITILETRLENLGKLSPSVCNCSDLSEKRLRPSVLAALILEVTFRHLLSAAIKNAYRLKKRS